MKEMYTTIKTRATLTKNFMISPIASFLPVLMLLIPRAMASSA